ncbi:MAG: hypothetical protein R3A80_08425 [Bdellovibrionota bacterium]
MSIRVRHWGLMAFAISMAFANDDLKRKFDSDQSERLKEIQKALASGDTATARSLARANAKKIDEQIKVHGDLGPHQRVAASQFGSALLTKEVLEQLKSFTMYSGNKISDVSNYYLTQNYGIELKYEESKEKGKPGVWTAVKPKDSTKLKDFMAKNLDGESKKVWESLDNAQKDAVATLAVDMLSKDIQAAVPQDGEMNSSMEASLDKKITELDKRVEDTKKDISSAEFLDDSEKRLLEGEKKVAQALADGKDDTTLTAFCEELAAGIENQEDLQRRIDVTSKSDPCAAPLAKRLAAVTASSSSSSEEGRSPAAEAGEDGVYVEGEADSSDDETKSSDEKDKEKKRKELEEQAKLDATNKNLEGQVSELQQLLQAAQGQNETLANSLNLSQACQRSVGSSSDPFGLNPDNQKNEKMIASLKDEMEKVLVDNYTATVCEQAARTGNARTAAENVISGLVGDGALTEADQKKLKGISQGAIDQAGLFARKRSSRMKLVAQLEEAASKRALTRMTMEYGTLINTNTISYLKTLSHSDLVGVDGAGFGGALTKASTNPQDPSITIQTYLSLYESAKLDLTKKYGTGDDYEANAECALTLAQVASAKWSEESGRMASLYGPSRQSAFNALQNLVGPTAVKNAPSSEVPAKKNYRVN